MLDLSLADVTAVGDITLSSLVASAPASEVVFEGTEELAVVLAPADAFAAPNVRRMILTAAGPARGAALPLILLASTPKGTGLAWSALKWQNV